MSQGFGVRPRDRSYRLALEALEGRVMLDSGVGSASPIPIVVGRVLSAYTVGAVQNHQETITYTVYNEQADPETGVLLATALEPGVTMTSASQMPDQSGQKLAWSLGTIGGYGRLSVALTVNLASPIPLQLDSGARAYAMLDGVAVSTFTPAATLRPGNVDPSLLSSTPDANTTDPFIQEEAAKLNYNPTQIFNFLHTEVGYNSYLGSVRGARGTLWSSAGNALDVASLGVALMRASGIPAQYAQGTLPQALAQQLILSMFPAGDQTVGTIPAGTQTSDPANDQQLLSETGSHDWFQFDSGGGMQDADPLIAGAAIGQAFTTPTGTFAEVPDSLREKTEIQLSAEIYSQVSAAFGGSGLTATTVLDQTFNDVDLVGRTVSVGNLIGTAPSPGRIFSVTTYTYTPYVDIRDEATPTQDTLIQGTPYQEILTNFPLASQILTGLFLNVSQSGPIGPATSYQSTMLDRIGYAARQGGAPASVSVAATSLAAVQTTTIQTINVLPGLQSPAAKQPLLDHLRDEQSLLSAVTAATVLSSTSVETLRSTVITAQQAELVQYAVLAQEAVANLEAGDSSAAYFDRPSVTIAGSNFDTTSRSLDSSFNLLNNAMRVIPAPGQNTQAAVMLNVTRGLLDNTVENDVVPAPPGGTSLGTFSILQQAVSQRVPFATIGSQNLQSLSALDLPADVQARITAAVERGEVVLTPVRPVMMGSTAAITWLEIDLPTGEVSGVLADGTRSEFAEEGDVDGEETLEVTASLETEEGTAAAAETNAELEALNQQAQAELNASKAGALAAYEALVEAAAPVAAASTSPAALGSAALIYPFLEGPIAILRAQIGTGDPPRPDLLLGLKSPFPNTPTNPATASEPGAANSPAGAVAANVSAPSVAISGNLKASWSSPSKSNFEASTLTAGSAVVTDAGGRLIGTGAIALTIGGAPIPVAVSGTPTFAVNGQGSLSFYAQGTSTLGVSGDWQSYNATAVGNVSLTLTTDALTLGGQVLPAGTYMINTPSVSVTGSGPCTSPNFAAGASVDASGSTVNLGAGSGSVSIGGQPLDPSNGLTLTGYSGTMTVSPAGNSNLNDVIGLNGSAGNVLAVSGSPATFTTDENTPVTFKTNITTNFADSYVLNALAPPGWSLAIDRSGDVTVTPASGLQSGTYLIQVIAKSTTNPDLVAQALVDVTITATQPGAKTNITHDSLFTVPYRDAQIPTAFRASIQNLGPTADTFNLIPSNVSPGFTLLDSGTSVAVPAGQTGILGIYLKPNPGQPMPAPGTVLSFTVTATSTTNPTITQTQNVLFTVPVIDAVTVSASPTSLGSTPGSPATTILTLSNSGNTPESLTLRAAPATGLTVAGLSPVTLQPGQTTTETVSLTPDASSSLNSQLSRTITATYGPPSAPSTSVAALLLTVRSAQVVAIQQASAAAGTAQNIELDTSLSDLADAMASLQNNPTDAASLARVNLLLGDLNTLLQADPALVASIAGLQPLLSAAGSGDVSGLLAQAPTFFSSLANLLSQEAAQQFTVTVSPSEIDLQPGQGKTLSLELTSQGTTPTTLALGTTALPAGVMAVFGQPTVTVDPGQSISVPIALSQSLQTTKVFTLSVTAKASLLQHTASAVVAVRPAAADVLSVTASPAAVAAGGTVSLSAQVFDTANAVRNLLAQVQILDAKGTVVLTLPSVPVQLVPGGQAATVPFGPLSTSALALGIYSVQASLLAADGSPLPGRAATTPLLVGQSVTASISSSPATVAPGTVTVTATISVANTSSATGGGGTSSAVDLYFTEYAGPNNVNFVPITYDGTNLTVGTIVSVAQNVSADGLTFLPNGNLLVANGSVSQVNPVTGQVNTVNSNGGAEHVALDPSGTKIWTSNQPGSYLVEVPLNPFSAGILHPISGDDTVISALAFDKAGTA